MLVLEDVALVNSGPASSMHFVRGAATDNIPIVPRVVYSISDVGSFVLDEG